MLFPGERISPRRLSRRVRARAGGEDGFTIVEVLVASIVLTVGIVALFSNFSASQKLGSSAEAHQLGVALAEGELERIRGLKWGEIGMYKHIPARSTKSTNPTFYEVTPESTKCTNKGPGGVELPNCYSWKWSETSVQEPMVNEAGNEEAYSNPRSVTVASVVKGATIRQKFKVYRFITWVNDSELCTASACSGANDAKRVLVAVTSTENLRPPVVVSSILNNRELSGKSPFKNVECEEEKVKVECIYQK